MAACYKNGMETPVESVFPDLLRALQGHGCAVLSAPPGSGKTTRVPLMLARHCPGRIIMLEPRRIAARAAARYMAGLLGESTGRTIGYRTRFDSQVSAQTRVEVVTEGMLQRRLLSDPGLDGVSCVIFDEFHERSLQSDLALAMCLEIREALRPDLMLLAMSATMDEAPVARHLGSCPVIRSEGRAWPVEIRWDPCKGPVFSPTGRASEELCAHAARTVRRLLEEEQGSILVFLPGQGEIRKAHAFLGGLPQNVAVHALYGDLGAEEQDAAIAPASEGCRKVVLATSIAETSLTIEGVRIVVDCGLSRTVRFQPSTGMDALCTERETLDTAAQRAGRAGRTCPGVCVRLWQEADRLLPERQPEMLRADLSSLLLDVLAWGAQPGQMAFLTPPPPAALAQAEDALEQLGAIRRDDGRLILTEHGRELARYPMHPRIAHMLLRAKGHLHLAAAIAAIAEAHAGKTHADLREALGALHENRHAMKAAKQIFRLSSASGEFSVRQAQNDEDFCGVLVSLAWPERIARRKSAGKYLLASGRMADLPAESGILAGEEWLAVAAMDAGSAGTGRIWLAAPLDLEDIRKWHARRIAEQSMVEWNSREQAVLARRRSMLGSLALEDSPLDSGQCPPHEMQRAVLQGIAENGISCLPWTPELRQWQARVMLLRSLEADVWPDVSDSALEAALLGAAGLEDCSCWLSPWLGGVTKKSQFSRIDLRSALHAMLLPRLGRRLDGEAPERIAVPSGNSARIDYACEGGPALTVKLQEMFGQTATPTVCAGRVPLAVHLLSPAGRPLQVTRDLVHFWKEGYASVRAEMRGRYPRHPWPEDPLAAMPTGRTNRALKKKEGGK